MHLSRNRNKKTALARAVMRLDTRKPADLAPVLGGVCYITNEASQHHADAVPYLAHSARPVVPRDRLIRLPEVERIAGIKKTTIYALQAQGRFPASVRITGNVVAWSEVSIWAWVQERIAEGGAK